MALPVMLANRGDLVLAGRREVRVVIAQAPHRLAAGICVRAELVCVCTTGLTELLAPLQLGGDMLLARRREVAVVLLEAGGNPGTTVLLFAAEPLDVVAARAHAVRAG